MMKINMITLGSYLSPVGELLIASKEGKLIGLWKKDQKYFMSTVKDETIFDDADKTIQKVKEWLNRYFQKERPDPKELPIQFIGTEFQKEVWNQLLLIPYGKTMTYGQIATQLAISHHREHMSSQAVGGAVSHNPVSIVVPCHRVIGSDGSLTGYAGGLVMKQYLLELEMNS